MPGTRPTAARRLERQQEAMRLRESAQARRADVEIDPDKVAFQAALGKLSNWQRTRYQRDGTPGSLENVGYYAALARG